MTSEREDGCGWVRGRPHEALYEFGHFIPQGIHHVSRIRAILEAPNSDLPASMREECLAMLEQIAVLNGWIDTNTAKIKELAAVAMAVKTFAPDMANFRNGRDFAAWLGLVPQQFSSGGKERLGRITRSGQLTSGMLIIGAMSRLNWIGRKSIPAQSRPDRRPRSITSSEGQKPSCITGGNHRSPEPRWTSPEEARMRKPPRQQKGLGAKIVVLSILALAAVFLIFWMFLPLVAEEEARPKLPVATRTGN